MRAARGRFAPGTSGNPGGRPKALNRVLDLARLHTVASVATLVQIMEDDAAPGAARVAAASAILDRGWGKPPAALPEAGEDGPPTFGPVSFVIVRDAA